MNIQFEGSKNLPGALNLSGIYLARQSAFITDLDLEQWNRRNNTGLNRPGDRHRLHQGPDFGGLNGSRQEQVGIQRWTCSPEISGKSVPNKFSRNVGVWRRWVE